MRGKLFAERPNQPRAYRKDRLIFALAWAWAAGVLKPTENLKWPGAVAVLSQVPSHLNEGRAAQLDVRIG